MSPKDELTNLTQLLDALQSKRMFIMENVIDVTEREIARLKPDIEHLKFVLARSSGK